MRRIHEISRLTVIVAAAALLAACGGGGGSAAEVADPALAGSVPAEASRSAAAMTAWLSALAVQPSEGQEPLNTDSFAPKQPEDAEPETTR